MERIHTLTVNGQAYTIEDPAAARISDNEVGADAWSGRNIIDTLCPAFTEQGAAVTCQPVQGYPLSVVSHIEPTQEGSGDPCPDMWSSCSVSEMNGFGYQVKSLEAGAVYRVTVACESVPWITVEVPTMDGLDVDPLVCAYEGSSCVFTFPEDRPEDANYAYIYIEAESEYTVTVEKLIPGNVRPIRSFDTVQLTHGNGDGSTQLLAALGQTVYGGSYDWGTGILTVAYRLLTVNEKNSLKATDQYDHAASTNRYILMGTDTGIMIPKNTVAVCDQLKRVQDTIWASDNYINAFTINSGTQLHMNLSNDLIGVTAEDDAATRTAAFKAFLKENPLTFVVPVKEPVTVQLDPQEILALSGQNTLVSDTGNTTVSGRLDPIPLLRTLIQ